MYTCVYTTTWRNCTGECYAMANGHGSLFHVMDITLSWPIAAAMSAHRTLKVDYVKRKRRMVVQNDFHYGTTQRSSLETGRCLARTSVRPPRGLLAQKRHSRGNDPHRTGIVGMDNARPSRRRGTGLPGLSRALARGNRVHCVPRRARVSVLLVCIQDLRNNSQTRMGDCV